MFVRSLALPPSNSSSQTKWCVEACSDCLYLLCWRVLGSSGRFSVVWDGGTDPCLPADILAWRGKDKGQKRNKINNQKDLAGERDWASHEREEEAQVHSSDWTSLCHFWCATHPCLWGCHAARVTDKEGFLVALWCTITRRDVRPRWWCVRRQRDRWLTGVLGWNRKTESVQRRRKERDHYDALLQIQLSYTYVKKCIITGCTSSHENPNPA